MEQGIWHRGFIETIKESSTLHAEDVEVLKNLLSLYVEEEGPQEPTRLVALATEGTNFSVLDAVWILDEMVRESNEEQSWEQLSLF